MPSCDEDERSIDIARPRFDLATFSGRLRHFISVTSPLNLLASPADLRAASELLVSYQNDIARQGPLPSYMVSRQEAAKFWRAKQLVESSIHPDTGEVIPLPFRMSAFVPTNLAIVFFMLAPSPSLQSVVAWQWVNQSLNTAVNYANANKGGDAMTTGEITTAYIAATTTAVSISVGLTQAIPRLRGLSGPTKALLKRFVPFAAVGSASVVNCGAMRWKEIAHGVTVFRQNPDGTLEEAGQSAVAGRRAVGLTALSRLLTNMPTLILPPLCMSYLQHRRLVPLTGGRARVTELFLIGLSLQAFLPAAIAAFPQRATIPINKLEPQFRKLAEEGDHPIQYLEYNKGL